jgi:predicted AAA+ superfamily ATPase
MVHRSLQKQLETALQTMPVVALLGPRQVGKTTLALEVSRSIQKEAIYLDLESDRDLNKLADAEHYLKRFRGSLIILDEVQRKPNLFPLIRGIVDERKRQGEKTGHFLLLGSASKDLLQQSSETLAGRIRYLELTPFTASEICQSEGDSFNLDLLWLKGGFPDSYLADTLQNSWNWRQDFISTYLERDIPNLGIGIAPAKLRRFWKMLAHYNGNQINLSELARSMEISQTSIKNYLDVLTDLYMIRQLPPWSGNIKKRLVKSPKIYLRDSGLLHNLLIVPDLDTLHGHPSLGGSWEGFVIENILQMLDSRWDYTYYRSATGVEVDLILHTPYQEIWAIEIKRSSIPKLSRGFYEACEDTQATHKWVITAEQGTYPMPNGVEVMGLMDFLAYLKGRLG